MVVGAVLQCNASLWAFQEAGFTPRAEEVVQIDPPTSCPKAGLCHCYCIWENRRHFLTCQCVIVVLQQGALLIMYIIESFGTTHARELVIMTLWHSYVHF